MAEHRRPLVILLWVLSTCCINLSSRANAEETPSEIAHIKDAALRQCVKKTCAQQQISNANQLQQLQCHSLGITSVEGLDTFKHIANLSLFNNKITHFNAAYWPQLRALNLSKNNLKQLTIEHTNLETLLLFGANLQALKLNTPALTLLRANGNPLQNLHYVNLERLKKLYLFDGQLKDMDIYHLPALQFMDVRQNPMPNALYDEMDTLKGITVFHDGNAQDWE